MRRPDEPRPRGSVAARTSHDTTEVEVGKLDGRVAFITGAARGQGRSHAVTLAEHGAEIIAVDLCADVASVPYAGATGADLQETVALVEKLDRRIVASVADVRDLTGLHAAVDAGVAELGRLDIVSANAGIVSYAGPEEMSAQTWSDVIDINLTGVFHTAKVAIPHLIAGGRGGSIVLTSSTAGLRAYHGAAHYNAAKHGVMGLMKSLAIELAPHAIRVNAVNPSQVDTPMLMNPATRKLFRPDIKGDPTREQFAEASRGLLLLDTPWVDPRDISNAIAFLASDEARYITGIALPVDAGAVVK
jgi:SDR family mycofactocin-dependent oxidoreductase